MEKTCQKCGKVYQTYKKNKKYCSRECFFESRGPIGEKTCPQCGKTFITEQRKQVHCSRSCMGKSQCGENNPCWRGGRRIDPNGYIRISIAPKKRRYEHTLIMEKHIGRGIKSNENVHHINGIKTDNSLENLQLLTIAEHTRTHAKN